jgi:hypothetical protein
MTDDDQIRALLDSAAPEQPDVLPAARTTAVRRRAAAARRQRLALAAVVVAVVGIGVGVPVLTSGDDPDRSSRTADDPAPPNGRAPACPTEVVDVSQGLEVDELPDGAVSARACRATFSASPDSAGAEAQTLPAGPVPDVDAFVDAVRDLPASTLEPECASTTAEPVPWAIVISYPDGTSQTLGASSQVCATVDVAGVDRSADEIVGLWYQAAGRERTDPSGSLGLRDSYGFPDCPTDQAGIDDALASPDTYTGDVGDLAPDAAVLCYVRGDERDAAYDEDQAMVKPDDVPTLGDDLAAGFTTSPRRAGRCAEDGPRRVLFLHGDADEALTLVENSCTGEFSGRGIFWLPEEEAAQVLENALDQDYFFG